MSFTIRSTAFSDGGEIPRMHSCDGASLSPELHWKDAPAGTQSFALIVDDPDAPGGTFTHWTLWNIPGQTTALPQGVPASAVLSNGARQGKNDFGSIGYGSPCPPPGKAHRYFFKLFALDTRLALKASAGRRELERAGRRHVLAQAKLVGTYRR